MTLSQADWRRLSDLLDEVLDLPLAERAAWIEGRSAEVPEHLRPVLRSMVAQGKNGLTLPPLPRYGDADLSHAVDDGLSALDQVGPYRLIWELGRGGMGAVWLAERSDGALNRQVALKLPHSSLPQGQLAARFARERDILSGLEHPHIARLYDAGVTADGRPYLALEYVEGLPLHDYCREGCLDLPARLTLFLQVLAAVQYAHGQLVVHRDIKPGNILVTADGQVRLLDFGIAKLLVDGQAKETELTQLGGRALTLQYAAPEQVLGQPIGVVADIYALGVVLYELLTGALPYRLRRDTLGDLEQAILDTAPALPSQAARETMPWAKRLKGDLDTIVLKALKKVPAERYATAAAFAEDIERHLRGEPVQAQADSMGYRTGKFLRRHRLGVAALALVVMALATGLGVALWQAAVAREEASAARAVSEFMQSILLANSGQQGDPRRARETTARELLDAAAERFDNNTLDEAPKAKIELARILSMTYSQLDIPDKAARYSARWAELAGQVFGTDSPEAIDPLLVSSLTLRAMRLDHPSQQPLLEQALAIAERHGEAKLLGLVLSATAEYQADHRFGEALVMARRSLELARGSSEYQGILLRAASIELQAGNYDRVRDLADEGIRFAETFVAADYSGDGGFIFLPALHELHALADWARGDLPAAEAHFRRALTRAAELFGEQDHETLGLRARLAAFLVADRREEAERLLNEVEAVMAPDAAEDQRKFRYLALIRLGRAQVAVGRYGAASANLAQALSMRTGIDASPAVAEVLRDRAKALAGLGRRAAAREVLARAIAMREKAGIQSPDLLREEQAIQEQLRGVG